MIVNSIFTIGYGDSTPKDPIARFLVFLCLVIGLYTTSLMVNYLWTPMSRREVQCLDLIQRI